MGRRSGCPSKGVVVAGIVALRNGGHIGRGDHIRFQEPHRCAVIVRIVPVFGWDRVRVVRVVLLDIFPRRRASARIVLDHVILIYGAASHHGGEPTDQGLVGMEPGRRDIPRTSDIPGDRVGPEVISLVADGVGADHTRSKGGLHHLTPGGIVRLVPSELERHGGRDHICPHQNGVFMGLPHDRFREARADNHQPSVWGHPGVEPRGPIPNHDPGRVGAVAIFVHRVVIVVHKVPANEVVHVAIAVVVHAVQVIRIHHHPIAIQVLPGVDPDVVNEIQVIVVCTGVNICQDHPLSRDPQIPEFWSTDPFNAPRNLIWNGRHRPGILRRRRRCDGGPCPVLFAGNI